MKDIGISPRPGRHDITTAARSSKIRSVFPTPTLEQATCDHCAQQIPQQRLVEIRSTRDPKYRALVCLTSLRRLRAEGQTYLEAVLPSLIP